jgi:hydroxymethylpyrimidine pyrophosphatase-like HAD family hydrolase
MRFLVLATDYDGTLATHGKVSASSSEALEKLRASGRRLVLATGRHLPDLQSIFERLELFDRVVAENGGLLYRPETKQEHPLCEPPNEHFLAALREKKIPFEAGRTIVASWQPHEEAILGIIRELGLDLQVIFNKGAVMVLPSGVNKGTGLKAALDELCISPHNVVAAGDAENDLAFMRVAACSVAVGNALPSVKERADVVLSASHGAGVEQVIEQMIADDLAGTEKSLQRNAVALGHRAENGKQPVLVSPRGGSILVAGPSGSGKSTAVAGILEQLEAHGYQFCLIDPEGDYDGFTGALSFGSAKEAPDSKAVFRALECSQQSVVIDLLGVPLKDRPGFFAALLPQIQDLRTRFARPHWLVIDEAHHMLPSSWMPLNGAVPQVLEGMILITVHPDHVAEAALKPVEVVMAIGKPADVLQAFAEVLKVPRPVTQPAELPSGEALVWFRKNEGPPIHVKTIHSSKERLRHVRSYAEGELPPERSFYFRGPGAKLNLRAQNLKTFLQLAEGVDDETWMYHLRGGHYSDWFADAIKDEELGRAAAAVEADQGISPKDSRRRIKEAVENRYTVPA